MKYELLSDSQLAAELLGKTTAKIPMNPIQCGEARPNDAAPPRRHTLLRHRLNAARELLKRELQVRMAEEPVMGNPNRFREWLRLYCGGLEREVFLGMFLDNQFRLIEAETLFLGTASMSTVFF